MTNFRRMERRGRREKGISIFPFAFCRAFLCIIPRVGFTFFQPPCCGIFLERVILRTTQWFEEQDGNLGRFELRKESGVQAAKVRFYVQSGKRRITECCLNHAPKCFSFSI